jgi:hypothetical protein
VIFVDHHFVYPWRRATRAIGNNLVTAAGLPKDDVHVRRAANVVHLLGSPRGMLYTACFGPLVGY